MKTLLKLITLALCASSLFAQTPFPLGLKPTLHGTGGKPIATAPRFAAAPLPEAASLKSSFYRTDQKTLGSCGPFSAKESYSCDYQKTHNGNVIDLSALDIYQRTLKAQGNFPEDAGVSNDVLLKVMMQGALLEKTLPYDVSKLAVLPRETAATTKERAAHQVLKGYAVPNDDGGYSIKQCIANVRIAPVMGTYWYNNGFTSTATTVTTKFPDGSFQALVRYITPYPKGRPVGGHDIPIVSYDVNMKFPTGEVGGVEIHNHWQGWGDEKGCSWIPMKWAFNPRIVDGNIAFETVDK